LGVHTVGVHTKKQNVVASLSGVKLEEISLFPFLIFFARQFPLLQIFTASNINKRYVFSPGQNMCPESILPHICVMPGT
jgi:hypothetical protein